MVRGGSALQKHHGSPNPAIKSRLPSELLDYC